MKKILCLLAIVVLTVCVFASCQPQQPEHVHVFGEWEVTKEPTCNESGLMTRSCECGETEEDVINAVPDNHVAGDWQVTVEPTCSEAGTKVKKCLACGEVLNTLPVSAKGHNFDEWELLGNESDYPADCTALRDYIRICSECLTTETKKEAGPDHTWGQWVRDESLDTCEAINSEIRICDACGMEETRSEPGAGHEWGEWAPANIGLNPCEFVNSQIRFCDVCDKYEVKSDEGPGHAWDDDSWYQINGEECAADCSVAPKYQRDCPLCGKYEFMYGKTLEHNFGEWEEVKSETVPNCADDVLFTRFCATCDVIEYEFRKGPGHAWDEKSWYQTNIEECAADCTVDAEFERVCPVCSYVDHKVEANKGHKWDKWTAADLGMNTCEFTNGQIRYCSVCSQYEIKFDKGAGHTWGDWTDADLGLTSCEAINCQMRSCTACGKQDTRYDEGPGHSFSEWDKIPNETDISDCVWDYEYVRHCDVCGVEDSKVEKAPGHAWCDWIPAYNGTVPQNCAEDVVYLRSCSVCNEMDERIDAGPGHTFGEWVVTALNETTNGIARTTCQVCNHVHSVSIPKLIPSLYDEYIPGNCKDPYDTYVYYVSDPMLPTELCKISFRIANTYEHSEIPPKEECLVRETGNVVYYLYKCEKCGEYMIAHEYTEYLTDGNSQ